MNPVFSDRSSTVEIAIVDDNPASLQLLKSIFSSFDYRITTISDGREAIATIPARQPDLILLDVDMPETSGFEVARYFKASPEVKNVPIIFISGLSMKMTKVAAFRAGGVDYITKPFQIEDVIARVETHLEIGYAHAKLEEQIRTKATEIEKFNELMDCFVPRESLEYLNRHDFTQIRTGDHVEKEVTIMFADIRCYTRLVETMGPEENFEFINNYLDRMSPLITRNGGIIDKFIGDEIMAIFPGKPEDAINAALEMQAELQLFNFERIEEDLEPIRVGVGVHKGPVVFGVVGRSDRMSVTVISDAVNVASRLEELTKKYRTPIIVSGATIASISIAGRSFRSRCLGSVSVKGRRNRIQIHKILPLKPFRDRGGLKRRQLKRFFAGNRAVIPFKIFMESWTVDGKKWRNRLLPGRRLTVMTEKPRHNPS